MMSAGWPLCARNWRADTVISLYGLVLDAVRWQILLPWSVVAFALVMVTPRAASAAIINTARFIPTPSV
jgi:hypothetical protein